MKQLTLQPGDVLCDWFWRRPKLVIATFDSTVMLFSADAPVPTPMIECYSIDHLACIFAKNLSKRDEPPEPFAPAIDDWWWRC